MNLFLSSTELISTKIEENKKKRRSEIRRIDEFYLFLKLFDCTF